MKEYLAKKAYKIAHKILMQVLSDEMENIKEDIKAEVLADADVNTVNGLGEYITQEITRLSWSQEMIKSKLLELKTDVDRGHDEQAASNLNFVNAIENLECTKVNIEP